MKQYYFLLTAFLCCLPLLSHAVEEQGEKQLKVEETILALGADEESDREAASLAIMENIDPYKQALVEAAASTDPEIQKRAKVLLVIGEKGVSAKSSPAILDLAKSALKAGEAQREKILEELSLTVVKDNYKQICKQKLNELPWLDDPAGAQKLAAALKKTMVLIVLPEKTSSEYKRLSPMLRGEKLFQLIGDICVYALIYFNEKGELSPRHAKWVQGFSLHLGLNKPFYGFWRGNKQDFNSSLYSPFNELEDGYSIFQAVVGYNAFVKKYHPEVWKGEQRK